MRDWLAALLLRWGLRVATDEHAWWFFQIQRLYWESPRGQALRRQFGDEEA